MSTAETLQAAHSNIFVIFFYQVSAKLVLVMTQ